EVTNDFIDSLPQHFPIRQYALDRLRESAQTFGAAPVLGREIANFRGRGRGARSQFFEYLVLLRMMVGTRVDLEIGDDGPDHLVVGPLSSIKDVELLLKNAEQLFNVAMLLAQEINNHREHGRSLVWPSGRARQQAWSTGAASLAHCSCYRVFATVV